MAYTAQQVEEAIASYAARPRTTTGVSSRFPPAQDPPSPAWLHLARNVELVLWPRLDSPTRGVVLIRLDDPRLGPAWPTLLPILSEHLRDPPAAIGKPAARTEPAPTPEEALERIATGTAQLPWMLNWFDSAAFHLETYANTRRRAAPPLHLSDPALDGTRAQLQDALFTILRNGAEEELLKLLADSRPG